MDDLLEAYELIRQSEDDTPALIPGIITREDKIICVAAPKVGKSILAQQLAMCVAGGHKFFGHAPIPGNHRVLYIAGEGDPDTLRTRTRRMNTVLELPKDRLWYWPTPTTPLNSANGVAEMLARARVCEPALTIVDPIYALMTGSMKDDEKSGDFVRAMNRYQKETGSAVFVVHHTHRPVKDKDGDTPEEDDQAYFGSVVWAAWPKALWLLRTEGGVRHQVRLTCSTNRDGPNAVANIALTMCEPEPLVFRVRDKNMGPSVLAIYEAVLLQPRTQAELVTCTGRVQGTVSTALNMLVSTNKITCTDGTYTARGSV